MTEKEFNDLLISEQVSDLQREQDPTLYKVFDFIKSNFNDEEHRRIYEWWYNLGSMYEKFIFKKFPGEYEYDSTKEDTLNSIIHEGLR